MQARIKNPALIVPGALKALQKLGASATQRCDSEYAVPLCAQSYTPVPRPGNSRFSVPPTRLELRCRSVARFISFTRGDPRGLSAIPDSSAARTDVRRRPQQSTTPKMYPLKQARLSIVVHQRPRTKVSAEVSRRVAGAVVLTLTARQGLIRRNRL